VVVQIEDLPGGLLRVSAPGAQGWAAAARSPHELARAIRAAFVEHDIAAYAAGHGRVYDGEPAALGVDARGGRPRKARPDRKPSPRRRSDTYDPADWRVDEVGRLVSPSGKRSYPATSWVAQQVIAQRKAMGLPALPERGAAGPDRRAARQGGGVVTRLGPSRPSTLVAP